MLRREAVPLFTVLAEALPRSDAATVIVLRNGKEMTLSLSRSQDLSTSIVTGDALRVIATIKQFVYVGGDVTSAGEKELRQGMTLTQVVMATGGTRAESQNKARITRRDSAGFLKSAEYNLSSIEAGKTPDPLLQPGDRIEVKRSM
jgi:protein involved in polysaccharide export with SLBB domain